MGLEGEIRKIERVQNMFVRWTIRRNKRTSGQMIREEAGRGKMSGKAGKRVNFEKRLEEEKGGLIARTY